MTGIYILSHKTGDADICSALIILEQRFYSTQFNDSSWDLKSIK
jgi:hypothetical protein